MDNSYLVYWMLYRDDEPTCLIRWDTNNESCVTTALNERIFAIPKSEFEMHVAFETFPVITMDDYRERNFLGSTR